MKKRCCHVFSVAFNPILLILAGKKDMHKVREEFEIRTDPITDCGVSCH